MMRTRRAFFPICTMLILAVVMLAVLCCGCDNTVTENVEASVFLPDGYYREINVDDDMYIPCKMPYACRTPGARNYCTKSSGKWEYGKGYCGQSQNCGRCLYPDYMVSDSSPVKDLPPVSDMHPGDTITADAGAPGDAPAADQASDL